MEKTREVDVAIVGGAFSGASLGLLLRRNNPEVKVLIVERSEEFDRKVGESTSEVAGGFISRQLGLATYLAREHVVKHGLRLWFNGEGNEAFERCTEAGIFFQSKLPTFQLDRSTLDQHILELAREAGCEVWRPAKMREMELGGEGQGRLKVSVEGEDVEVKAKWIVDASGKASVISRKRGTHRRLEEHPVNAVWARFRNVKDLDGYEITSRFPEYTESCHCPRATATNHLMGYGWWCWIIPLQDGDVSAGVVYDPRLFEPEKRGSLTETLHHHLLRHPVGRELFSEAQPVEKDTKAYSHLPYHSTQVAGDGWLVVGDAAGFIDPLYSQGLDYCGHTVYSAKRIIEKSLGGECVKQDVMEYADNYQASYQRWYKALYRGKYRYLGDAELMFAAFVLDVATYFTGPVRLTYNDPEKEFCLFPYHGAIGGRIAKIMAFYNHRLGVLAEKKLAAGVYGRRNLDHRYLLKKGFSPGPEGVKVLLMGIFAWLKCEVSSWFLRPKRDKMMMEKEPPDNMEMPKEASSPQPMEPSEVR